MRNIFTCFALAVLCLVFSACHDSGDAREKVDQADKTKELLAKGPYCRKAESDKKQWTIYPVELGDFVNKSGYNYEIYGSWKGAPSPTHTIENGDWMYVSKKSGSVVLEHSGTHSAKSFIVETKALTLEKGLWGRGEFWESGTQRGTFYLYRLKDSPSCKHRKNRGNPCRTVHFEYFDAGYTTDLPNDDPSAGKQTVFPGACEEGDLETDDGDGDEGLK